MHSCIYAGRVRHRRFAPRPHAFDYRLFMMYLDLDEIERVFAGRLLWSATRPAPARFHRADHLGEPSTDLSGTVRDLVESRTGFRPDGPIRLLTHLRYFGYCFNPVSFYYCFDRDDSRVDCIVAEVNNTPWGERHCYVMHSADGAATGRGHDLAKRFHVSPFMPMDIDYDWRFSAPGEQLAVHMRNLRDGRRLFDATLRLRRRAITGGALARTLAMQPMMTAKVVGAIYFEALRLWLKRIPFHDHPDTVSNPR